MDLYFNGDKPVMQGLERAWKVLELANLAHIDKPTL